LAKNGWRFVRLGALTATIASLSVPSLRAIRPAERIPTVDALTEDPPDGEWPFASVIVPARNEERNLPRLIPSLLRQRYPNYEVIVVDDQSTDDTPRILADFAQRDERLKVVQGAELPKEEGWLGKPHAMCQGVRHARGEWLLFTDADTDHNPLSLSSSVAYAIRHNIDLLTIFPFYELCTPVERIVMPVAFMGIINLYPTDKVNDPNDKRAIANGQYMLIRRDVYEQVGGIERVKDQVVEDLEFGRAVKGDGHRLYIVDGQHLTTVRMYTNFREVWEGWSKNTVIALRGNPAQALFALFGILGVTILPIRTGIWARRAWRTAQQSRRRDDRVAALWVSAIATWSVAFPIFYRRQLDKVLGLPVGWSFTQPIGTVVMGLIILTSLVRLLRGKGVTWKGRTYHKKL